VQSWNLHWAHAAGAEHANDAGSVTLDLDGDGHARAVDGGKKVGTVLDGERCTEKSTSWSATWTGTWRREEGGVLNVDLLRDGSATCALSESDGCGMKPTPPTVTVCSPGSEHLLLRCNEQTLDVAPSIDDLATKPTPVPVWTCQSIAARSDAIGTPFPWVFGKERCLERSGGVPRTGPLRYAYCQS
ncbi:MAG: hypothetical protein ACHREM_22555, partial [Polyangiales bacterium]